MSAEQAGAGRAGVVDLDARYGRTRSRRRRTRVWAIVVGSAVLVTAIAWVAWVGLFGESADLETRDIGYSELTDSSVTVRWELTVPAGSASSCAVQALDDNHGVVGWKIVDVPASEDRTRQFSETIRTTSRPVTGLIYRCWLT